MIDTSLEVPLSPEIHKVLRTFKKFILHIEPNLHYPGLTDGPLEDKNNNIKTLKRVAFGYRNFEHCKDCILLMTRLYQPQQKEPNSLIAS